VTTTETKRAKRRTFKDVEKAAYERGFAEGGNATRSTMVREFDRLVEANHDLRAYASTLEEKLANVSLRKLAWSRITGLFGAQT
jgi:hypothetical protein